MPLGYKKSSIPLSPKKEAHMSHSPYSSFDTDIKDCVELIKSCSIVIQDRSWGLLHLLHP